MAVVALIDSIVGCLLPRSPISIDLITQPPPASAFGEAVTSALDLPCNKKARREDAGGDLGHTEEDRCSLLLELVASEARARSLPAQRHRRMLFPARLPRPRPSLHKPGKPPQRKLPLILPPSTRSRRGTLPPPVRPLTRPAKKTRERPRQK
jgi:hypothetical protein